MEFRLAQHKEIAVCVSEFLKGRSDSTRKWRIPLWTRDPETRHLDLRPVPMPQTFNTDPDPMEQGVICRNQDQNIRQNIRTQAWTYNTDQGPGHRT